MRQLQKLSGSTLSKYENWAKAAHFTPVIDELGQDARLLWLGPKRTDRVLLYCHGGGFVGPVSDFNLTLWHRVQGDMIKRPKGQEMVVVVLEYCEFYFTQIFIIIPTQHSSALHPVGFPTQLEQLMLGLSHLFSMGIKPQNLQLSGDSAGANLILQLLSHTLHPLSSTPLSPLSADKGPFRGICLISPWVVFGSNSASHKENDPLDLVSSKCLQQWGAAYASPVPESQLPYIQASLATQNWWAGVDKLVDRVRVTAGQNEVLRDDIVQFAKGFEMSHPRVDLDIQAGGVHADPLFDYAANTNQISKTMESIVDWLAEGFANS
jgi:acetyl esterase/lipase